MYFYEGYHFWGMHLFWWVFWIIFIIILFGLYRPVRKNK